MVNKELGTVEGWENHAGKSLVRKDILIATRKSARALRVILKEIKVADLNDNLDQAFHDALDGLSEIVDLTDKI